MKYLTVDYHFVRDLVQLIDLRVIHIHVGDQLEDALTKSLLRPPLFELCNKIGVSSSTPSLQEKMQFLTYIILTYDNICQYCELKLAIMTYTTYFKAIMTYIKHVHDLG